MKIYTKQGDTGETQVYAKQAIRLGKDDLILQTYGDLDELNAHVGLLISLLSDSEFSVLKIQCQTIQHCIFQIGFAISDSSKLNDKHVSDLESLIDAMQAELPPQTHFILPGGSKAASQAHICRTVCRRAERSIVALSKQHSIEAVAQSYINRLSDYLFVVARSINAKQGISDIFV